MFWRNPCTHQDNMCRTKPAPYKEHLDANSQTPQAPLKGCLCGTLMTVCEDGNLPAPILMSCILCSHAVLLQIISVEPVLSLKYS